MPQSWPSACRRSELVALDVPDAELQREGPGHDAWIVGDDPCVVIDWQGYADCGKH